MFQRLFAGQTVDQRYASLGHDTTGFNYMRIILAVAVLVQHSIWVVGGEAATRAQWGGPSRLIWTTILPMFFSLSGFLVAGSLMRRPSVRSFVTLRALRLIPALVVEVMLSALVLGPLVTSLPLHAYFTGKSFWIYFANIVGWIHYQLPGVFVDHPARAIVNKSLWTIPFELECYLLLILLYVAGIVARRHVLLAVAIGFAVIGTLYNFAVPHPDWQFTHPQGRSLVVSFIFGVAGRFYSDKVRLSIGLFLAAVAVGALLMLRYKTAYLATIPLAYVTIYLGLTNPVEVPVIFSGDYSYGLYLFAFPIQQTVYQLLPWSDRWWLNAVISTMLAALYAAFSWWCIESKVLARKKKVVNWVEGVRLHPRRPITAPPPARIS